ncbi:MAG: InlB B-repeat-containing protein [Opitutaceae bacterium]|nr:InlB B-repeat-containing protein [Opitutaceae bacterium]
MTSPKPALRANAAVLLAFALAIACLAHARAAVTVTLDPQGGALDGADATLTVTPGQPYGALPVPVKPKFTFLGWWTLLDGTGALVTPSATVATDAGAQTLYAKWQAHPVIQTAPAAAAPVPSDIPEFPGSEGASQSLGDGRTQHIWTHTLMTPLSFTSGASLYYKMTIPQNTIGLLIQCMNHQDYLLGRGGYDIYLKRGEPPTTSFYDHKIAKSLSSYNRGTEDMPAGVWYIMFVPDNTFTGFAPIIGYSVITGGSTGGGGNNNLPASSGGGGGGGAPMLPALALLGAALVMRARFINRKK